MLLIDTIFINNKIHFNIHTQTGSTQSICRKENQQTYEVSCKPHSLIYSKYKSPRDIEEGKGLKRRSHEALSGRRKKLNHVYKRKRDRKQFENMIFPNYTRFRKR